MKKIKTNSAFNYEEVKAGYYDLIYKKKSGIQSAWHHLKFDYLKKKINPKDVHLDIGCGAGTFLSKLQNKKSFGVDVSKNQILYAKKNYQNKYKKFKIMKKGKIPFKSKYFDSISLLEIIEHLSDREISKILNECYRVLKKDGKLFITTPNYYSFWPILEFIINQFSDVSYEEQHINKFNKKKLISFLGKYNFTIKKITSYIFCSFFFAIFSFNFSLKLVKIDNILTKFFPGLSLYVKLVKIK